MEPENGAFSITLAPPAHGTRVLVDRLWPRGLTKEAAKIDLWLKEIAPSTELREWYSHDPERWSEFKRRYREELKAPERKAALEELRQTARDKGLVTLVFGAKEEKFNQAAYLLEMLNKKT